METNPGIIAVRKLAHMGYRFRLVEETIKAKYQGPGKPEPDMVTPLFAVVRDNKPEVVDFLTSFALGRKINETNLAGERPISICPKCQGQVFLRTSFGQRYCYQCLFNNIGEEMGLGDTGFTEIDSAVEAAIERSAILEFDGGLDRKKADETAWTLHVNPVIDNLISRKLISFEGSTSPEEITASGARHGAI